ncbi:ABC transporter substrate-binding protein [Falsochrobactrum sp. TDYN1]|uniref:ABC transporter substrate-binding protein n=1 Tax=Falsochrobactrum tianjinense TaxID=2706015 RepID=A0A949PM21_9HYPH|nr:ABC transporter substrate-binding protein [Falsochrobactrum sp. TDYN1]MBV2143558.1 ABC transporter substrate-binding protein [Falsochrobactrum sp. TDYN1]
MAKREFDNDFVKDALMILREKTNGKTVHRRQFLGALGALGVMPLALRLTPAHAQSNELVIVNWGGDAVPAFEKILAAPYTAAGGLPAVVEGSGPTSGKIRAMVEAEAVSWDVCDRNLPASIELGQENLLEEIDWNVVDPNKLRDVHRSKWGVGSYLYTFALTWDSEKHPEAPKNWADFWNIKEFPGTRTLRNNIEGMLEAALLADGVAPADIYPIDVERAFAKIREIKEQTIFWTSGSQSQELFRNGEVTMGNIWHTRSMLLRDETKGRVKFDFNQGILFAGAWIVPKGNPAGKSVWDFIASTQNPDSQVELFKVLGNGPINPAGSDLVPAEMRADDPGNPENFARQVAADAAWYAEHYSEILNQYTDLIAS